VLVDTLSGIYCSLDILARKRGTIVTSPPNFNQLIANPLAFKSTQIREIFDRVISALKPS
jgi:hypothetical protein